MSSKIPTAIPIEKPTAIPIAIPIASQYTIYPVNREYMFKFLHRNINRPVSYSDFFLLFLRIIICNTYFIIFCI